MQMHPYLFDKLMEGRQAELRQKHRHTWIIADLKASGGNTESSPLRQGDEALRRKALLVLEEMLQHENSDLRLRAAEIILKRTRGPLFGRFLRRI
jgi:hypothetical protein